MKFSIKEFYLPGTGLHSYHEPVPREEREYLRLICGFQATRVLWVDLWAVYTWANVHTALLSKCTHIFTVLGKYCTHSCTEQMYTLLYWHKANVHTAAQMYTQYQL
jgi:hypothetical protein